MYYLLVCCQSILTNGKNNQTIFGTSGNRTLHSHTRRKDGTLRLDIYLHGLRPGIVVAGIEGELYRLKGHKRVVVRLGNLVSVAMSEYIAKENLEKI